MGAYGLIVHARLALTLLQTVDKAQVISYRSQRDLFVDVWL